MDTILPANRNQGRVSFSSADVVITHQSLLCAAARESSTENYCVTNWDKS